MLAIIETFKDEPAEDLSQTFERLSRTFGEFGSSKFVKQPMSVVELKDILAD